MREKKENDRTTRFLVTLTLLGGTWYVLKGITIIWVNTFSEIVYSESIINNEHLVSMSLLIVMLAITSSVVSYLYLEYKTYRYYEKVEEMQEAIRKADKSFDGIFSMIKVSAISIIVFFALIFFINEIKKLTFLLFVLIGIFAGIIYIFILEDKIKNFFKKYKPEILNQNVNFSQLGTIIYISLIILVLSFSLTLISFESNQEVEVNIKEETNVPLQISLKNYNRLTIEISVYREKKPKNIVNLKLEEDDLQRSLIEVYETILSNESLLKENNNTNNKFPISLNEEYYLYNLDLSDYLLEGKNELEILILSEGNINKKTVRFVTSIFIEGGKVKIPQKNFKVSP